MKRAMMLGAVVALVFAAHAGAGGKATTRVTLDYIQPTPSGTIYTGDIFSSRKACKNRRQVIVFRVRPGADQKVGATKSYKGKVKPGYYWSYEQDGLPPHGDYYAKTKPTDACKGDRSANYTYEGI